jgi:hypothetical protein
VTGDYYGDLDSLETAVLNDSRLDGVDDSADYITDKYENAPTMENIDRPTNELMSLVAQTGLFAAKGKKPDGWMASFGHTSLVSEHEKNIMVMQSTFMAAMKANKRPAINELDAGSA